MKLADMPPFRFGLAAGEFMECARLHRNKRQVALAEVLERCVAQIYEIRCQTGDQLRESVAGLLQNWTESMHRARAAKNDDLEIIFATTIERFGEILLNAPGEEPTRTIRAEGRRG